MAASAAAQAKMDDEFTARRMQMIKIAEFGSQLSRKHDKIVADPKLFSATISDAAALRAGTHDTAVAAVANMAGNLATLTEYGKEAARDLMGRSGLPTYDVLFKGLRTRFRGMDGAAAIDLEAFGRAVSRIMYDVPTFRPYWGLMDLPLKEKKARQAPAAPRVKDSHVLERPQEVVDQESHAAEARNATRSSDIFAAIHRMLEPGRECLALKVQCDDGEERRVIPMVQALFDPFSYSQTVENLFYFSFLVKHKMAAIHVGKLDSAPYIYAFPADSVTSGEGDEGEAVGHSSGSGKGGASSSPGRRKSIKDAKSELSARQFVLQLDPDAWEKVCAEAGLTAPRLPHRKSRDSKAPEGYAFHQDTFTKAVKGAGASAGASATSASKRKAAAAPAPSPDSESEPEEAAPTAKRTRKV